jgi:hypothetical protein
LIDLELDGSTTTYTVRVLTNQGGPSDTGATYIFEQVSVFIDDVSISSWSCVNINSVPIDPPGVLDAPIAPLPCRAECEAKGGFPVPQQG